MEVNDSKEKLSANDVRNVKRAIVEICSEGQYVDKMEILEHLNALNVSLSEQIIEECIVQLVQEGELKKSDTEEKWAATPKAHGVYQVKSQLEGGGIALTSARLSPEGVGAVSQIIQKFKDLEKNSDSVYQLLEKVAGTSSEVICGMDFSQLKEKTGFDEKELQQILDFLLLNEKILFMNGIYAVVSPQFVAMIRKRVTIEITKIVDPFVKSCCEMEDKIDTLNANTKKILDEM